MNHATVIGLAVLAGVLFCSCGKAPPETTSLGVAEVSEDAVDVKIGCARCLHKMRGLSECTPAIRFGTGRPTLADGIEIPASEADSICEAERDAKVVGEMEDGIFFVMDTYLVPKS